jgi:hypothetical protein
MKPDSRRKDLSLQQLKKEQKKRKIETFHGVSLKQIIDTNSTRLAAIPLEDDEIIRDAINDITEPEPLPPTTEAVSSDFERNLGDVYKLMENSNSISETTTKPGIRYEEFGDIPPDLTLKTTLEITSS